MRVICSIAVLMLLAGCQGAGGGSGNAPTRPQANRPAQNPAGASSQTYQSTQATPNQQVVNGWTPDWWLDAPTRTSAGAVQASGTATAGDLRDARRQAIDSARESALTLADAGQRERVVQAATNPNANGSYTVWVVLELGGQ